MNRHQQQHHPREKTNINWYYYHLMVPIRLYIIHCTQHTILIATSSHMDNHEWLLHCYPCTKSSLPTWNYFITQSIASPNSLFPYSVTEDTTTSIPFNSILVVGNGIDLCWNWVECGATTTSHHHRTIFHYAMPCHAMPYHVMSCRVTIPILSVFSCSSKGGQGTSPRSK